MRTTVDLDADLLREIKARAHAGGTTLSAVVQQALRAFLEREQHRSREPFELIEAGEPGGRCPSPAELDRILADDDLARMR